MYFVRSPYLKSLKIYCFIQVTVSVGRIFTGHKQAASVLDNLKSNLTKLWTPYVLVTGQICTNQKGETSLILWYLLAIHCTERTLSRHGYCKFSPPPVTNKHHRREGKKPHRTKFPSVCPTPEVCSKELIYDSSSISKQMLTAFAGECIDVVYSPRLYSCSGEERAQNSHCGLMYLNNVQENRHVTTRFRRMKNILYIIDNPVLFDVNVTFVKFDLAGPCWGCGSLTCFPDNEFLWVVQENPKHGSFYYCMTRPQWSTFPGNKFSMYFRPCGLRGRLCHGKSSSIFFQYQIIDKHLIHTQTDHFFKVMNLTIGILQISTANINFLGVQLLSYFIKAHKYQQIVMCYANSMDKQTSASDSKLLHTRKLSNVRYFYHVLTVASQRTNSTRIHSEWHYTFHTIPLDENLVVSSHNFTLTAKFDRDSAQPYHKALKFETGRKLFLTIAFVQIDLLGKIFNAELLVARNNCCPTQNCFVSFSWRSVKRTDSFLKPTDVSYPAVRVWFDQVRRQRNAENKQLFVKIPPKGRQGKWRLRARQATVKLTDMRKLVHQWLNTQKITWEYARRICRGKQRDLPTFVSQAEVELLKDFIKYVAPDILIKAIFIGLQMHVHMIDIISALSKSQPKFQ